MIEYAKRSNERERGKKVIRKREREGARKTQVEKAIECKDVRH